MRSDARLWKGTRNTLCSASVLAGILLISNDRRFFHVSSCQERMLAHSEEVLGVTWFCGWLEPNTQVICHQGCVSFSQFCFLRSQILLLHVAEKMAAGNSVHLSFYSFCCWMKGRERLLFSVSICQIQWRDWVTGPNRIIVFTVGQSLWTRWARGVVRMPIDRRGGALVSPTVPQR